MSYTAEERQDKGEKRRRIDADRNDRPSAPADVESMSTSSYVQVNSSTNSALATSSVLPNKPSFLPPRPAGFLSATTVETPSIDRAKVQADNMSAAERLKAELRGEVFGAPAASETPAEEPAADTSITSDAASDVSRGVKRKADEAEVPATRALAEEDEPILEKPAQDAEGEEDDEDDDDVEGPSVLIGAEIKPAVPKPLNLLGDNMVEQEDTVK